MVGTIATSHNLFEFLSDSRIDFNISYHSSASKSTTSQSLNVNQKFFINFQSCSNGKVEYTFPFTQYLCGIENTSSVGILGQKCIHVFVLSHADNRW
jgi:hypothetical protein